MRQFLRFQSIHGRLNGMMMVPVVLFIGVQFLLISVLFEQVFTDRILASQARVLRRQEAFIAHWMDERAQDVRQLALLPEVRDQRPEDAAEDFDALLLSQDELYAVVYADENGITQFDTSSPAGLDVSDREYFRTAIGGRSAMSDVIVGRASGNKIFIFAEPVRDPESRAVVGVIFAPVLASAIDQVMSSLGSPIQEETYLLDDSGLMITRSDYEPRLRSMGLLDGETSVMTYRNDTEIVQRARQLSADQTPYTSYAGLSVIGSYHWLNDGRWLLVSEQPRAAAFAAARRLQFILAGISILFVAISLVVIRLVSQSIAVPVQELAKIGSHFLDSHSDLQLSAFLYRRAPLEIQTLSDSLHAMGTRVRGDFDLLARSSLTDPLTGVHNRAYLSQEGLHLLKACARNGQPCAAIMIDIDHFKAINDTFGHAAGDDALRSVASVLGDAVRESDIVVRYGGEEFAILVTNSTIPQARELAERVRTTIEESLIHSRSADIALTVSGGVSGLLMDSSGTATPEVGDLEALIAGADSALYAAKRAGRNRVKTTDDHDDHSR